LRYVFTLTSGRTGTRTLSALLGANLPGARIHHERLGAEVRGTHTPSIPVLLAFNHFGFVDDVAAFWDRKWADVAEACAGTWVETSHLLMKAGLIRALDKLEADAEIHLVVLRRDRETLLRSFMRLQDFRRIGNRLQWYLHERAPRNLVPLPLELASSAEGMALWYILEVEARVELSLRQVASDPRVRVHELKTSQLGDPAAVFPMLAAMSPGLQPEQVHIPPRLNASRVPSDGHTATEARCSLVDQVAGFDAATHVDRVLRARPDPFGPRRIRPRASAVASGTPLRFIGSPGRSGATLAVDLLGCHPWVSPVYETGFVPSVLRALTREGTRAETADAVLRAVAAWLPQLQTAALRSSAPERYVHGPQHLRFSPDLLLRASSELAAALMRGAPADASLAVWLRTLFDAHAQSDGCPAWANQMPDLLEIAPTLLTLLLDAKLLITIRDPRDVALSVGAGPGMPSSIEAVPRWWKRRVHEALRARRLAPDRVCIIRYEDLVCHTGPTLDRMQRFFDLPVQTDAILARRAEAGIPLEWEVPGAWRHQLSPEQANLFGAGLGEELDYFGYPPGR